MGRRFEELEEVYNTLTAINFNFDTLPATNKYRKYKEWKLDPDLRKRADGIVPSSGRKTNVGLAAFGLSSTDSNDHVLVKIGSRALAKLNELTDKGKFNLVTTAIPASYSPMSGLVPAKAILAARSAGVAETSKITGQRYKSSSGVSYTIPFGKGAGAAASEIEAQEAILKTTTLIDAFVISFTPEKLRRN